MTVPGAITRPDGWQLWQVPFADGGGRYLAAPPGGPARVVDEGSPEDREKAIGEWLARDSEEVAGNMRDLWDFFRRSGTADARAHFGARMSAEVLVPWSRGPARERTAAAIYRRYVADHPTHTALPPSPEIEKALNVSQSTVGEAKRLLGRAGPLIRDIDDPNRRWVVG
jgi:hypothetical protein